MYDSDHIKSDLLRHAFDTSWLRACDTIFLLDDEADRLELMAELTFTFAEHIALKLIVHFKRTENKDYQWADMLVGLIESMRASAELKRQSGGYEIGQENIDRWASSRS